MSYELELQIEELRAELRNAIDSVERREIAAELVSVKAKLTAENARFEAMTRAEPPC